jgi:hypothetical protein
MQKAWMGEPGVLLEDKHGEFLRRCPASAEIAMHSVFEIGHEPSSPSVVKIKIGM